MDLKRGTIRLYNMTLCGVDNPNEFEELIKVFLKPSEYCIQIEDGIKRDKNQLKREIFEELANHTGKRPDWGILTGVRPVKLTGELVLSLGSISKAREALLDQYLLSEEKVDLLIDIYTFQQQILQKPKVNTVGLYMGIPFCPTRCLYCSFTSNQASQEQVLEYVNVLGQEMDFVSARLKALGIVPESIYVGGGTPTSLNPKMLSNFLTKIVEDFGHDLLAEFTVEAGRPDTLTEEKLLAIQKAGVGRISINPQSMRMETLKRIGRSHTPEDIIKAFYLAKDVGIPVINMDIIAGLPGESPEDFDETVDQVIRLMPENITVHTLATKRASQLAGEDREYHYARGEIVREMLKRCQEKLFVYGYRPYYLYRQKHMAGNLENIGWCREGTAGIYNIRIMEEAQTIVAMGAGGITKVHYPEENRLERIPNVSNYEIYMERLEEMLDRKRKSQFFGEEQKC